MTNEYTPTTQHISDGYKWLAWDEEFKSQEQSAEEFQRWLRKVKADTLRDFAKILDTYSGTVLSADSAAIMARVKANGIDRGEDD